MNRALRPCIGAVLWVGLSTGCMSLDASEELDQAALLVETRANVDADWDLPWDETATAWDGRGPLSSDAAVRVALQNNRAIRADVESIVMGRSDLVQAHLLPNPVIRLVLGFPTDSLGGTPLAAAAVQQLAWLWQRPDAIDAAEADLRARILAVSDAALELVAETRHAHGRVFFANRAVGLQQESVQLLEQSTRLLADRFTVGEASRLDLNRADFDLQTGRVRLADRRTDLARAQRELLEILGRADASVDWTIDGDVPFDDPSLATLSETDVVQLAQTQRLDVAAAAAVVEGRAAKVDLSEQGRIPDVTAGVGFNQNFSNRTAVGPAVAITPKIFDDNSARVAKAESAYRQARIEADRVRQAAITEARQAWVGLVDQQEIVRAYQNELLGLAESNLLLARQAFDIGEADLTVLLEAQRQLNDARIDLIDRQRRAADLLIELERAAGGSLQTVPPLAAFAKTTATPSADETQEAAP